MMMADGRNITIYLPDDLLKKINKLWDDAPTGTSRSEIIRNLLKKALKNE